MVRDTLLGFPSHSLPYRYRAAVPPSGGAGGALNPGQGQPPGGGGGDMLTRPVLTPGRAYSVGANARRGAAPCPTAYNIRRRSLPHYGEQAATPTPPKNSVAAVRAAAMPGRRILNAAGAGQGLGSPASADARPAGGARSRGPLCSPAANTGREGGDPLAAPLLFLCPRTRSRR